MLAKARIAFDLVCPACEGALLIRVDREGKRYAICKTPSCKYYDYEFTVPTGEQLTKLLKSHEGENK